MCYVIIARALCLCGYSGIMDQCHILWELTTYIYVAQTFPQQMRAFLYCLGSNLTYNTHIPIIITDKDNVFRSTAAYSYLLNNL